MSGVVASAIDTAGQEEVTVLLMFCGRTHQGQLQEHCRQQ